MPTREWDRTFYDPQLEDAGRWAGVLSIVAYLVMFPLLYEVSGWEVVILTWIPVLLIASFWGGKSSLIGPAAFLLFDGLYVKFMHPIDLTPDMLGRLVILFALLVFGGVVTGQVPELRRALEQEISHRREIESRYENLFENTNDAVFIIGLDERHIAVNQRAAELLGYSRDELLNMHVRETIIPDQYSDAQQRLRDLNEIDRLPLYERHMLHKDGSTVPVEINASLIRDSAGKPLYIQSLLRDIRHRKALESDLIFRINHDDLTKLPNRTYYMESLHEVLSKALGQSFNVAIFFLDLNGFKAVNDRHGHAVGDQLLFELARRIESKLSSDVMFARMGGDEFALRLAPFNEVNEVTALATHILSMIEAPFIIQGHMQHISCSIGISLFPQDGEQLSELLRHADEAMYRAKADRRRPYMLYSDALED